MTIPAMFVMLLASDKLNGVNIVLNGLAVAFFTGLDDILPSYMTSEAMRSAQLVSSSLYLPMSCLKGHGLTQEPSPGSLGAVPPLGLTSGLSPRMARIFHRQMR